VFGSPEGDFQDGFKTAWESLLLVAHGHETKRVKPGDEELRNALTGVWERRRQLRAVGE